MGMTIIDQLSNSFRQQREEIALVDEAGSLTYGEVDDLSDRIAEELTNLSNSLPPFIAIDMQRGKEYIVTMLAILKAGKAYVPLDDMYPRERVEYMLQISQGQVIVTNQESKWSQQKGKTILSYKEMIGKPKSCSQDTGVQGQVSDNSVAYVIFTSGSTGKPKGIMINHKNVVSMIKAWKGKELYEETSDQTNFALVAPFVFDMSVFSIFVSLSRGYTLHIMPDHMKKHGEGILAYYEQHHIHLSDVTPSHLRIMAEELKKGHHRLDVNQLVTIGEALPLKLAKEIFHYAQVPSFNLINAYGPTECTVMATRHTLTRLSIASMSSMHIGKALANAKIYILDEEGQPCPIDKEGEIFIAGDCVGVGYANREDLTEQVFLKSSDGSEHKMYATGDMGKWLPDDNLHFIGRRDSQIKLNGHRIELGEIEKNLLVYHGVQSAKVMVDKSNPTSQRIVAYMIGEAEIDTGRLIAELKKTLPHYMIPAFIQQVDCYPLTTNGKVDEKELLKLRPTMEKGLLKSHYSSAQEKVIALCGEILGRHDISLDHNFFQLGGHSLDVVLLAGRLATMFKKQLEVPKLYQCEDLGEIISYVEQAPNDSSSDREVDVDAKKGQMKCEESDSSKERPIIPTQKVILDAESALKKRGIEQSYLHGITLMYIIRFNLPLEYQRLVEAMEKVVEKHAILRSTFTKRRNRYYIKELKAKEVPSQSYSRYIQLEDSFQADKLKEYLSHMTMDRLPLIELIFIEDSQGEQRCVINVHHAIFDFMSLTSFMKELITAYEGDTLQEESYTFEDFRREVITREQASCHEFWAKQIANRQGPTVLPVEQQVMVDKYEPSYQLFKVDIPFSVNSCVHELSQRWSVSKYTVYLGFFMLLVSRYTKRDDVIIGTYIPGRNMKKYSDTLGMFTTAVPVRMRLEEDFDLESYIQSCKEQLSEILAHQDITLWEIYRSLSFADVLEGELVQILFNYENKRKNFSITGDYKATVDIVNYDPDITKKELYVGVIDNGDSMYLEIKYNGQNYSRSYIHEFIMDYFTIILDGNDEEYGYLENA